MGKLKLLLVLSLIYIVFFAGDFRNTTTGNTAQLIHAGNTQIDMINVVNPGGDTVYVHLYDTPTAPTYTTTPYRTLQCYPHQEIFTAPPTPSFKFINNCYVRTVIRGVATSTVNPSASSIINSTVTPTSPPIIQIHY